MVSASEQLCGGRTGEGERAVVKGGVQPRATVVDMRDQQGQSAAPVGCVSSSRPKSDPHRARWALLHCLPDTVSLSVYRPHSELRKGKKEQFISITRFPHTVLLCTTWHVAPKFHQ